jgi:PEP-CTERM motif
MKKLLVSVALAVPLLASAQNLLSNGSFELGAPGLVIPSWTTFSSSTFQPSIVPPETNFGTVITPNDAMSPSPDAAGTQSLYFVDDIAPATVFQTLPFVAAGTYLVGFDYFIPENGLQNPADATLNVCFGPCFSAISIDSSSVGGTWFNYSTTITIGPGATTFSFAYSPEGASNVFAKDIIVDRAFVVAVPEPGTYALFAAGLLAIGTLVRRRSLQR